MTLLSSNLLLVLVFEFYKEPIYITFSLYNTDHMRLLCTSHDFNKNSRLKLRGVVPLTTICHEWYTYSVYVNCSIGYVERQNIVNL